MRRYAMEPRAAEILLVEDNPGDVRLTREAFKDARVLNPIQVATNGDGAMALLRSDAETGNRPRPDLVLLDLNLPGMRGDEVLVAMKHDPDLGRIPVVILTSSTAERDILMSYELDANCYVNKPVDPKDFLNVIRTVEGFWLQVVQLSAE